MAVPPTVTVSVTRDPVRLTLTAKVPARVTEEGSSWLSATVPCSEPASPAGVSTSTPWTPETRVVLPSRLRLPPVTATTTRGWPSELTVRWTLTDPVSCGPPLPNETTTAEAVIRTNGPAGTDTPASVTGWLAVLTSSTKVPVAVASPRVRDGIARLSRPVSPVLLRTRLPERAIDASGLPKLTEPPVMPTVTTRAAPAPVCWTVTEPVMATPPTVRLIPEPVRRTTDAPVSTTRPRVPPRVSPGTARVTVPARLPTRPALSRVNEPVPAVRVTNDVVPSPNAALTSARVIWVATVGPVPVCTKLRSPESR